MDAETSSWMEAMRTLKMVSLLLGRWESATRKKQNSETKNRDLVPADSCLHFGNGRGSVDLITWPVWCVAEDPVALATKTWTWIYSPLHLLLQITFTCHPSLVTSVHLSTFRSTKRLLRGNVTVSFLLCQTPSYSLPGIKASLFASYIWCLGGGRKLFFVNGWTHYCRCRMDAAIWIEGV